jgi:predicted metalloprotease with PDZ domain
MVALALDLELRLQTDGHCTLDDVMRELWKRYGRDGSHGLPEGGFEALAEEVSGLNLNDFFRHALRSTVDPPVGILLAQFGIRLHMRAAENDADRGGKAITRERVPRPWLGFRTRVDEGRVFVATVEKGGANSGLPVISANDEIIALNGRRVTAANYEALLARLRIEDNVSVDVFRRDQLLRISIVPSSPPRDRCYLSLEPEADEAATDRRVAWLGI